MTRDVLPRLALLIVVLLIGYALGCVSNNSAKASKYTQYKIINLGMGGDTDSAERTFNQMASEGWEVVEWQRQPTALLAK